MDQPVSSPRDRTTRVPEPANDLAALEQEIAQAFAKLNAGPWQTFRQEAEAAVAIMQRARLWRCPECSGLLPNCHCAPTWRCFHCDFATNSREEAELHFGSRPIYDPMCRMTDAGQRREYISLDASFREVCAKKIAAENEVKELRAEAAIWREHDAREAAPVQPDAKSAPAQPSEGSEPHGSARCPQIPPGSTK